MMNRWVALAFGGSMGVLMLFAAGSLKLGDMGMKEHMGWRPPVLSARALSDDGAESMPGRALSDAPSFRTQGVELNGFVTSVVAPDGRIIFVTEWADEMVFFDPSNGNFERISYEMDGVEDAFWSSVTVPEGKIILVPTMAGAVGILDPVSKDLELVDITAKFEDGFDLWKFEGGALAPNGKVIFAPSSCSAVGIFDPASKDLEFIDIWDQVSEVYDYYGYYMFSDAVATTDSKVVFVPQGLHAVGIFDPATNTFEAIHIDSQISDNYEKFGHGTLAPNGKVIFAPWLADAIGIFDPTSKEFELVDISNVWSGETTWKFYGAALAPNGKVVFGPNEQPLVGVFDPANRTFESIDVSAQLSYDGESSTPDWFYDAVTAPNGEIIFAPYQSNEVGIFSFPTTTTTTGFTLKLKLKVKGGAKALLKVKVANGHVNATAKVKSGSRRRRG
jgi:streptogramin lyase